MIGYIYVSTARMTTITTSTRQMYVHLLQHGLNGTVHC
eukprot:XP_001705459.1 Hypothetical protein GL50803_8176 [Giardia lamblia ATCC 50803]